MKGKKYVERCLWEYYANLAEVESLSAELDDLMSVRGHSYEAHIPSGASEPVFNVVNRRLNIERRIAGIGRRIGPVKRLKSDFEAGLYRERYLRDIFNIRYMEHGSVDIRYMEHGIVDYVMKSLHISQPTYWRNKEKLIELAKKYFAEE